MSSVILPFYDPLLGRLRSQDGDNSGDGGAGVPDRSIIADPPAQVTRIDPTYGACCYLDAVSPELNLAIPVWHVSGVRLRIVSANPAVTGNIVLTPLLDGIELDHIVVPVGATPAAVEFPLAATGQLVFRRDYENEQDTLKDGEPVSAIIINIELGIKHE